MIIKLKKTKAIPFQLEGVKGEFICDIPKAGDFVSFWAKFRGCEGTEEEKAQKQTELVVETFSKFITEVKFEKEVTFQNETGEAIDPVKALKEFFNFFFYQKGMEFLNPSFGSDADPLE